MSSQAPSDRAFRPLIAARGRDTLSSEDNRGFLQQRVAAFSLLVGVLAAFFLLVRAAVAVALRAWGEFNASFYLHALGMSAFLIAFFYLRGGPRTLRAVQGAEVGGFFLGCLAFMGMGLHIPVVQNPELTVIMALSFACIGRAVHVPSSARRTFFVTAALGLPLLVITFWVWRHHYTPLIAAAMRQSRPGYDWPAPVTAGLRTLFAATWWVLTTVNATAASHVIYGLRQEVRDIRRLGQYALERKLGEGGMGVVYEANHAMLRRPTAIKLLRPDRAGASSIARFEREVRLTARLTHPHTVTVFDYGRTPDGVFYYAMELLDGADLSGVVAIDGPQSIGRVLHVLDAVAGALAEAHGIGLIHRDIKPNNIMLCRRGGMVDFAKVLDFGLVKELNADGGNSLTNMDALTGTPQYVSPEAIRAPSEVDAQSDIYALGAVGYFLLTGTHVFSGNTLVEICGHHLYTPPEPPSRRLGRELPADLETLLLECLEKDSRKRPSGAEALQRRVRACRDFGTWSDADARAWWERNADKLEARRSRGQLSASDSTVAIDLARRPTLD